MWGVADYEFHVKETHSDQKDNGEFSAHNKDTEEFEQATKLRDVTIVKDDCNLNLCEARYWRQPLSWTNSQLNLPVDQKPICTVGDYEPYGMEINNKPLIKALHSTMVAAWTAAGEEETHMVPTIKMSPSPPAIYRTEPVSCAGPDLNSQSQPGQHHHKAG